MTDLLHLYRLAARSVCGVLLLSCAFAATAQDAQDISRLIRIGQYGAAMQKIDAALTKNPKDPQARFLKGVLLSEQGKADEAITTFQSLTEDYPELPEPYNNLASLFAAKGQYEKAKTALEMAIQINPGYSTAYENLGDVYARMASQSYDKALQLDKSNTTAQGKLTSIRGAFSATPKPATPPATTAPPTKGDAAKAPTSAAAIAVPAAAAVPTAAAVPALTAVPAAGASAAQGSDTGAILAVLNAWAGAWAARNVDGYFASYSKSFAPEGKTREEWEALRRTSFPAAKGVQVDVEQPQISMLGADQAQVTFVQRFRSDRVKLNTRKVLLLARENGVWHIARERIVP